MDYNLNKAEYDQSLKLGYAYSTEANGLYGGIQLLSNQTPNYYAYNNDGSGGSINLYDGFSESEKFTSISNGLSQITAGVTDISLTMASGPYDLAHADSVIVSFALMAGHDLNELKTSATNAQILYDSLFFNPSIINEISYEPIRVYPSIFKDKINIKTFSGTSIKNIQIYDSKGGLLHIIKDNFNHPINLSFLKSGTYFISIETEKGMIKKEMIIKI
jgi:hypothetical protein